MIKIFAGYFLLINLLGCVNPTYTNRKLSAPPPSLISNIQNLDSCQIYSINHYSFINYLTKTGKKFNLIVSYTYWCPTAKYSFDEFVSLSQRNNVSVYFITADDWFYIDKYKEYLRTKKYTKPTFILDINEYGKKFNPHPKNEQFFKEMCGNCIKNIEGFPSYVLLDSNLKYLHSASGLIDSTTMLIINSKTISVSK